MRDPLQKACREAGAAGSGSGADGLLLGAPTPLRGVGCRVPASVNRDARPAPP
jgi:hypothetical protein